MFKQIFEKLKKNKVETEDIEKEFTRKPSGTIVINYFEDNGDFTVGSEINDVTESSAEMLALLMVHMTSPDFQSFLFESLRVWADDEEDKIAFNVATMTQATKLDSLVMDIEQANQEDNDQYNSSDVAVSASAVFNFKEN
jgi:hypothetical protein